MNVLLFVIAIGFAQMCSSARTTGDDAAKLHQISKKIKTIEGANRQWIDEFTNITKTMNRDDLFHVKVENIAKFYSMAFGSDFAKTNQSILEFMRDNYGFGTDISIGNKTYLECIREYVEKCLSNNISREEINSILIEFAKRFKIALTTGVEASKARKINYLVDRITNPTNTERDPILMDILVSIFHDGASVSERAVCNISAEVYEWQFDCTKYANDGKDNSEGENDAIQSNRATNT